MDRQGILPIEEKFLQPNFLFAMGFRTGFVFGRVIRRRPCMYKPWKLINADGDAQDIGQSSFLTAGCLQFRDPRNTAQDILHLAYETDRNHGGLPWFLHGSIGIKPQRVRMYLRMPQGQDLPGKFPDLDPIVPSAGDNVGYVSGVQSPYEKPTDFLELVIPPKLHVCAEWYNMDYGPGDQWNHQPVCNLMFMTYWFQMLNRRNNAALIRKIAKREVPASFFTAGIGDVPLIYGADFEREWGETTMTLDEAAAQGGKY